MLSVVTDDTYAAWTHRHPQAARELAALLMPPVPVIDGASEARVQSEVRLEASQRGCMLWRNNVGQLPDENGRPVRYGLANESKALNETLKSHDLIGWRRRLVTPAMVGSTIAQFLSRETKTPGWHLTPGDKRGQAQAAWGALVLSQGGDAAFATGVGTL